MWEMKPIMQGLLTGAINEYSKKPFAFSNDEAGFASFKDWMDDMAEKHWMESVILVDSKLIS